MRGKAQRFRHPGAPEEEFGELGDASASDEETKRQLLNLARVYGFHRDAAPGTLEHAPFLERSEETFEVFESAAFHLREISAA